MSANDDDSVNGNNESEPTIGAEQLDEFFHDLRETILDLEQAYQARELTERLKHIDLKTRFGSSVARAYHQLAKQSSGRQSHVDDTEGRRVKTVHDLLTQMREELFEINTWFHAEIVPSREPVEDGRANGASQNPGQSVNESHRYRITECVAQAITLRLDQIIAGRSWGIGFVFNDQSVTDKIVALMTANALRRFSRDLQDLATVLPRVLRGDPDRFPQLVPPRSGRAFEQLITDIVNEDDRHAQLSGLCEDYLQKTDIRVNYPDLDRKRGARVQVTIASSGEHHRKKVEGIRHPEEFVILSPWSLASAVPQIGASGQDGAKPLFSTELIGRFWKCFPNPPSDIDDLSRQLKKMLCRPLNSPIRDPRGPLSEVPEPIREFIRIWVHDEALRSTRALRQREAIDGRYRRGRDGRLRMRRLPNRTLSESSREFIQQYPAGTVLKATVTRIDKQAAWVSFADDLKGRVDRKEISWSDAHPDLRRYLEVGKEYEFRVRRVNITRAPAIIELSRKRTIDDPWHQENLRTLSTLGTVEGKIVRWASYGVFVEVKPDLVGLVHESSLAASDSTELQSRLPVGAFIKVAIDSINLGARRMSLVPADQLV